MSAATCVSFQRSKPAKRTVRTGRVGEEHDKTVDTDAPATRWRETVLHPIHESPRYQSLFISSRWKDHVRIDIHLIDPLRLVVALLLLPHLLLETQPLLERVVQLRVRVAELLPAYEPLKPLAQARP